MWKLTVSAVAISLAISSGAMAADTGTPKVIKPAAAAEPAVKAEAEKPAGPREFGGKMPLPVDQRIERQNSPADKLVVEVTHAAQDGSGYVAYVKVVWGDLDNVIKGTGKQYYSDWDGGLKLTGGATEKIDEKIQFDDGKPASKPKTPLVKTGKNGTATVAGPHAGSGRDEVEIAAGPVVEWKAGVVGALDGLRIKITSPTPVIKGTLVAGKFTLPITIRPESGAVPQGVAPATSGTRERLPGAGGAGSTRMEWQPTKR